MTEEIQLEALERPDPSRPDWSFVDDDFVIRVVTMPAALPVWCGCGRPGGLGELVVQVAAARLALRIDCRWKVVTVRSRRRILALPRVIGVEFVGDDGAAEFRRVELLTAWRVSQSSEMPAIGAVDRGRMRRAR